MKCDKNKQKQPAREQQERELVQSLIKDQFPEYAFLPICQVKKSGHDNRTFRLGDKMAVRLPIGKDYAPQVEKELFWLPRLKRYLSLPISTPLAKGKPTKDYPFPFLKELQAIDASKEPAAGKHNFYRVKKNVWVHGDIAIGNLLVKDGKLCGVIDFGMLGVGDPSCDFVIAWTFLDKKSRKTFFKELSCDKETWSRARGWALWKALITYNEKDMTENAKHTINAILKDYENEKTK
ncbi:38760_t:CDS:2 [Gigaspora margarita]|uniref:38760_t:CDS:1 n=1 Tax=Gigaspora margarita TaxID=4874 RepID=A0ABN7UQQ4_GIGMA|nr:38760_t:CDS:2 [Gigaspora margarita]